MSDPRIQAVESQIKTPLSLMEMSSKYVVCFVIPSTQRDSPFQAAAVFLKTPGTHNNSIKLFEIKTPSQRENKKIVTAHKLKELHPKERSCLWRCV